jgi:hypothetical protein
MQIILMVTIVAVIGVVFIAVATYLVDRSAARRDRLQDR